MIALALASIDSHNGVLCCFLTTRQPHRYRSESCGMTLGFMCPTRRFLYIFRFFVLMLMGVVTATLFIRTEISPTSVAAGNLYFGAPPSPPRVCFCTYCPSKAPSFDTL